MWPSSDAACHSLGGLRQIAQYRRGIPHSTKVRERLRSRRHSTNAAYLSRGITLPWWPTTDPPVAALHSRLAIGLRLRRNFTYSAYLSRGIPLPWRPTTDPTTPFAAFHFKIASGLQFEAAFQLLGYLNCGISLRWRPPGRLQAPLDPPGARARRSDAQDEETSCEAGSEEAILSVGDQGRAADKFPGRDAPGPRG